MPRSVLTKHCTDFSPERLSIESPSVGEGEEARVTLKLDSAPDGLAGYEITVPPKNGAVADMLEVEFPPWAKLSDSSIEDDSVLLKAVDLEDAIKPGASNIVLATIVFENTKRGESLIEVNVEKMDDDEGNPTDPSIEPGRLIIKEESP